MVQIYIMKISELLKHMADINRCIIAQFNKKAGTCISSFWHEVVAKQIVYLTVNKKAK